MRQREHAHLRSACTCQLPSYVPACHSAFHPLTSKPLALQHPCQKGTHLASSASSAARLATSVAVSGG